MKTTFTATTVLRANHALIASQMGDEVVMMNIERGNYYGLNPVASRIWQLLDQDTSLGEICARLVAEYDVPPAKCTAEVSVLIGKMIEEGLVEIKRVGAE